MNKLLPLAGLGVVACLGWWLGGVLSKDALSLTLGVVFGLMAGVPAILIAMSRDRAVRHVHVHRVENVAETPQASVGRISVLPASNRAHLSQNAQNGRFFVVEEEVKRLGVGR